VNEQKKPGEDGKEGERDKEKDIKEGKREGQKGKNAYEKKKKEIKRKEKYKIG